MSAFFHPPIFRPPSQMLRCKCVTEVALVKYTGLYFKTQMNLKVMTAVYIKLQASKYVKDLFMAEVTCCSFSLNLFNLILFVLHLSFLTLFIISFGHILVSCYTTQQSSTRLIFMITPIILTQKIAIEGRLKPKWKCAKKCLYNMIQHLDDQFRNVYTWFKLTNLSNVILLSSS